MIRHLLATALMLTAAPGLADETWETPNGPAIYEADIDGQAVISISFGDGSRGQMYFPGLAGNFDDRGTHSGYWIMPGFGDCAPQLTGIDGMSSTDWGRVVISFDTPAFPTSWTATFGLCFGDYTWSLRGETTLAD